jgi:pseudouridine-5'-phosphate glycosidase
VVCAGAKSILDLRATLEWLETSGVPVLGFGTDRFPSFYSQFSRYPVDQRIDSPEDVAKVFLASKALGLSSGLLVAVPVPREFEIPSAEMEQMISRAIIEAEDQAIRGRDATPFLLQRIAEESGGRSLKANIALLENNAAVASKVAIAICNLI